MSAAGRLRRRLVVEAPTEIADGTGGVVRGFVATARVWAEIVPLSFGTAVSADRMLAALTHRVVLRAGTDVSTAHRLRLGARVLRVLAVREADAPGRFLECLCAEEQA